ncbi:GNAT family N-acetyltransferase [Rhizobium mesosinicum]|uniref:GNAT family N-acetyltransferase n=1 Tax=Rhizobium mesosinicum TaxID=335017 RepID=A0ABS7GZH4_9HYPH|nr:GNAT family N-acetyltransferase [Rhizobium mesosinicum]MBW9055399.1 GNAT family N-acetyltransferase [Rhizobium mesosinicum]
MSANQDTPPEKPLLKGLSVRALRISDAEAVTELMNLPGYRAGTLRPPFQSVDAVRKRMENPSSGALNLVVEFDGKLVANGGMNRFEGRRQHAASLGMGVHDDFTGRGIGTFLMAAMVDAADNWHDIKRLELTVYTDNDAAICLYEKFGFEREGLLRSFGYRDGQYVDAYTMARLRS